MKLVYLMEYETRHETRRVVCDSLFMAMQMVLHAVIDDAPTSWKNDIPLPLSDALLPDDTLDPALERDSDRLMDVYAELMNWANSRLYALMEEVFVRVFVVEYIEKSTHVEKEEQPV